MNELEQAADAGNVQQLSHLAFQPQPQSQQLFMQACAASSGRQVHPVSCVVGGWLARLQAVLFGSDGETLLAAGGPLVAGTATEAREAGQGTASGAEAGEGEGAAAGAQVKVRAAAAEGGGGAEDAATPTAGAAAGELAAGETGPKQAAAEPQSTAAAAAAAADATTATAPAAAVGGDSNTLYQPLPMPWLQLSSFIMSQALAALSPAAAVLMSYAGLAAPSEDKELMKDVEGMMEELADAVEGLRQLHVLMIVGETAAAAGGGGGRAATAAAGGGNGFNAAAADPILGAVTDRADDVTMHNGEFAAGVTERQTDQEHIPMSRRNTSSDNQSDGASETALIALAGSKVSIVGDRLTVTEWLVPVMLFMDVICCYCGDSEEVPLAVVGHFLAVAKCFTPEARAAAAVAVQTQLKSSRMVGAVLAVSNAGAGGVNSGHGGGSSYWVGLTAELPQLLQLPSTRKRKRK